MPVIIHNVSLKRHDISTRMPFKYGIATMTHLPHLFVRLEASFDGRRQIGISADHLPPKWFTKDPNRDPLEEIDDMINVIDNAGEIARQISAESVFNFWIELYDRQDDWAKKRDIAPLLAHFGTSLIERALIDALCRRLEYPFHRALAENSFGIDFASIRPELAGRKPADWLAEQPLSKVKVRHTVGLADPIRESDIGENDRVGDGLPESLEACIRFYRLKHFKIKICGDPDTDIARIRSIAELLQETIPASYAFTLDGNEQFCDTNQFRLHWNELTNSVSGPFFDHLLFVEQPFHREIALGEGFGESLRGWESAPPIIIDESDGELDSLPKALALGYRGTSHKNCKGVFKGIINRATINFLNRQTGAQTYLMSGEDLANIGPIANHQDLVVQAALGNESVERNGHHYFNGLSVFDQTIQDDTFSSFPSLYAREPKGVTCLSIRNGELSMKELNALPFGTSASLPNLIRS